jgi:hypothetical protein
MKMSRGGYVVCAVRPGEQGMDDCSFLMEM